MAFVPVWPLSEAAESWPIGEPRDASACPPDPVVSTPVARLKRRSEFLRVAATRKKWVAPGLVLQVRPHGPDERLPGGSTRIRVGFTASRKVGNAVARNRVRRRLRAAVERVVPECAGDGHDFVVIGRAATLRRPFDALVQDLRKAIERLNACREGTQGKRGRRP